MLLFISVFFAAENQDYYRTYYREATRNAIAMVEQELEGCENKDTYLEKFRQFCDEDNFFQTMVELVTPKESLAVISHGDCWTNNLLFRYVDGDIAEVCGVEQTVHFTVLVSYFGIFQISLFFRCT